MYLDRIGKSCIFVADISSWSRSSMDRTSDSGSDDMGSIPVEITLYVNQ